MAPGAKIVYVGAPNNYRDLDAAVNHVVDRRLADIVTNSYGFPTEFLPPGYIKPLNDTFIQAALEGITVLFSSGDNGDEVATRGYRTTDWPASSPWVTAVGGTSLAAGVSAADPGGYLFETGWSTTRNRLNCSGALAGTNNWCQNEVYLYGAGGGASRLFPEPSWQQGVVPSPIAFPSGTWNPPFTRAGREVPDISVVGDPNTGMLIGQTQSFFSTGVEYGEFRIGGTSLSSPLMAGMFALAQQLNGSPLGFVNPTLYTNGAVQGALTDVKPRTEAGVVRVDYVNGETPANGLLYSVRTLGFVNSTIENVIAPTGQQHYAASIFTRPGYDDVTGLGSPTASFYQALANAIP
jgi:subtilase family serine protease